eukprot:CAMPEP_0169085460 /NCGR_PEP_ID=MMETSP1015-20121227/13172_1 /TAXON_ID=342587 /ORGANISM="Karlodinium micrum, Strain CCMP2283" /LENGTH=151 /DNA_ID=CAMNT_0009145549 /DNA_START=71 /DNA_END=526 /DNA_ORIENTATION=+
MTLLRLSVFFSIFWCSVAIVLKGKLDAPNQGDARCQLETARVLNNGTALLQHLPMKPKNLAEYKSEAEGCLTWCGSLDDKCFKGCLNTCSNALGPPQCVGFALEKTCFDACNSLADPYGCLKTVDATNTAECHGKLQSVTIPSPESKCLLP